MSRFLAVVALAGVTSQLLAAPAPVPDDPTKAVIEGSVVDEAGRPVAGARVRCVSPRTAGTVGTAADGSFRLLTGEAHLDWVPVIAANPDGSLATMVRTPSPSEHRVVRVRVVLRQSRGCVVRVQNPDGSPIAGATVLAADRHQLLLRGETGAAGTVTLHIPAGATVHQIVAAKPGAGFACREFGRPPQDVPDPPSDVSLSLAGSRPVRVRAVGPDGRPVAGVEFLPEIVSLGQGLFVNLGGCRFPPFTARTDADGVAAWDWVPAQLRGHVEFVPVGGRFHLPEMVALIAAEKREDATLTGRLVRTAVARGRVTRPDGNPAPGVLVHAAGRGNAYARTAADGTYAMTLWPGRPYIVAVADADWSAPPHLDLSVDDDTPINDLDFRLDRGTVVSGLVTAGSPPRPAADATVSFRLLPPKKPPGRSPTPFLFRHATADADGRYRIRVAPGRYEIRLASQGVGLLVVEAEGSLTRDLHIVKEARAPLAGVVQSVDGTPVANAAVVGEALSARDYDAFQVRAGADGRFRAIRRPTRMVVYAFDAAGRVAGLATLGSDDADVVVSLKPAAQVRGRVVDAAGRPRPGAVVRGALDLGQEARSRTHLSAVADAEGRFTLGGLAVDTPCRLSIQDETSGLLTTLQTVQAKEAKPLDVGDLQSGPRP